MQKATHKPQFLDKLSVDYLKSQIETGHASRTKNALQQICKYYRIGLRIRPDQLSGIEQSIVGLIYTQRRQEKVRRWALNALARLGREANCIEVVKHVLQDFSHEPQTMAAAIAATYRMSKRPTEILATLDSDPQIITLAALQHIDAEKLDLSALPLDVEAAEPHLLQLALVVVGLDRAPINLLNPRHTNAEMVKALGGHHDNIVSQYSVWAITENPFLGVKDLGLDIRDIEAQPTNVRSWVFQLLASTPTDAEENFEYIALGAGDPEAEARTGLAVGLKDTFFDGLENITIDWFISESDPEVSQVLMDHLIKQARHCQSYEPLVLEFYEKEPRESQMRQRMEVVAAGTPLYIKMKQIDVDDSGDLFRRRDIVTNNNTFNINGNIQGGAVSLGGDAKNSGVTSVHYDVKTVDLIRSELAKAERELFSLNIDHDIKSKALNYVAAAKSDPDPGKISKAIEFLGKAEELAVKALGAGTAIGAIVTALGQAAGLM